MGNSNSNNRQRPPCAPDHGAIMWSSGTGAASGALGGAARLGGVGIVPGAVLGGAMAGFGAAGAQAHNIDVCLRQEAAAQRARDIHVDNAPIMRQGMPGSYIHANRPK